MLQICFIKHCDLSQHYLNRSQLEEISQRTLVCEKQGWSSEIFKVIIGLSF